MPLKVGEIVKLIEHDGWYRREAGMSTYVIIIERSETGTYGAWCPDLPGCVAAADDQEECLQLMREAIEFHLEGMRANGEAIPEPNTVAATTFTTAA